MTGTPESAYEAGRQYAEQENGALAGMAEMPDEPTLDTRMRTHFERGYHDWREEQERNS